ncbi:FAD-binding oxidoreductase [Nocardioides agariphilus]|uniref:FAD-binding oxidoreductase n=1 Tax=Nocardioides agariphilus TaxID=433664 RepID=A0A930VRU9_9ACTN|nr:FAD-binding and (Fe-S)-binding domain-containing protein [Nocardioides agariphilus]MBF4768775.1 FAD-binding oxidoreductase [Nocardioides agariphilus]
MADVVDRLVAHVARSCAVEIDVTSRARVEYSYDASNYRVAPGAVAFPRSPDEVSELLASCHRVGLAVTARGGGTSMAGNAVGRGMVVDFSRYMNRIVRIDEASRSAVVEPGAVLSVLSQEVSAQTGGRLTFAPDPSSSSRATVGGSVANDACGNHSVRHGRTSDHVLSLDLVLADGVRVTADRSGLAATDADDAVAVERAEQITHQLEQLTRDHLGEFRLELDRIPRQVSGFHLSHLLPERGFDVARALVGSEGACAVVVSATVALVDVAPSALLMVLGYHDVVEAARDVPTILRYSPAAVEGIDVTIVETMRARRGPDSVAALPDGRAWLFVDLDGENSEAVAARGGELIAELGELGRLVDSLGVSDADARKGLWRVREDGAGLSSRIARDDGSVVTTWPGWEDSAVAPERLADYLSDFRLLLQQFGLVGVMYGHFGAGCMHIRINFDLASEQGRSEMARFLRAAARLVVAHGGTLSGEHGDGRARSELLSEMYSPALMAAFGTFKRIFDPEQLLNPGVIVNPPSMTADLALAEPPARDWVTAFDFGQGESRSAGGFPEALHRCIGIGRCRSHSGGVMCPSFRATGAEKDSTRARARVLQEMVRGTGNLADGWRAEEVLEVLDLCLSCKACSSDCPTGVDMATYKAEFLHHHYAGRRRPLSHYSLGWLPVLLSATSRLSRIANAVLSSPVRPLVLRLGGLTPQRSLPHFTSRRALRSALGAPSGGSEAADVVLVVDTFTKAFRPEVAGAARRVLESHRSAEIRTDVCCGLTWVSTGQLAMARKRMSRTVAALDDGSDRPVVVIEPSCAAALRKDLPELLGSDAAHRVAGRVRSFAQQVSAQVAEGWLPRTPVPPEVTVQTHCHEYAVFDAQTQRGALRAVGVSTIREATGCCGVAGNFGFEPQHYDLSMWVAEQGLAPALRAAPDAPVLTDGFSCHMQVRQLTGRHAPSASAHLAQLLDPADDHGGTRP